ncbi:D-amino acid dehydrogenase [Pseudomonas reactans]|uniref:D-amino acid dehydrogenase n=1 Tax=Pseudomonas reactans TaxID=117680 RepID=A0ABX2QXG4_9PSED|nr:D-amino acid dehydrogenase [Pseudomonas reactans]NWA41127.1 D-amino acid dehydrogenase [Pseudomonas reactans]NWD96505.1 D-amino acid dehydrogenase [Pseudomonas reactans]
MKVLVLGAGLAGIPAAYYLARDGHEVTVIDRQPEAAMETSFANGSLLCQGHSYPWASPAAPGILAKSLFRNDQALRIAPRLDPRLWSWLFKFLCECPRARANQHAATRLRLASYSQAVMREVVQDTRIEFFHTDKGLLYVYRTQHCMDEGLRQMRVLEQAGLPIEVVSSARVAQLEPALKPIASRLVGGVFVPSDGTGDARLFTVELARACAARGVNFMYNTQVLGLDIERNEVRAVSTSKGVIAADAIIVAMGAYSSILLRRYGVNIDVFPVKGYSMTVPIRRPEEAPTLGGLDEDNLLAFSVLGNRLRLTATAEFTGYDMRLSRDDFRYMTQAAKDLFPTLCDYTQAELWCGLRPATPDGNPLFGPTQIRNLFLNTGHGSQGWTMACGSGKITADLVAGRTPDIDMSGLLYQ